MTLEDDFGRLEKLADLKIWDGMGWEDSDLDFHSESPFLI